MKAIEISIKKKRLSKIKTKDYHIKQIIEPDYNYDWIKDKQSPYDDSEYTKENY